MLRNSKEHRLLKEYVKSILSEDEYSSMIGAEGADSIYGVHYGSDSDLFNTFVKPFTDVIGIAKGKTKEMSQRTITLARVAFQTLASTFIPILGTNYKKIFENEKEKLDQIKSEYKEVYDSAWGELKKGDAAMMAFFCFPGPILAGKIAKGAPKATLNLLSILGGGELEPLISKIKSKFSASDSSSEPKKKSKKKPNDLIFGESLLREVDENEQKLANVVTNSKVINKVLNSTNAKKMQQEARGIVQSTLQNVYDSAKAALSIKSIDEFQKKFGKLDDKNLKQLDQLEATEKQKVEAQLLSTMKKSAKDFYVKNLTSQVEEAIKSGIPESSGYVDMYKKTIQKIQSL